MTSSESDAPEPLGPPIPEGLQAAPPEPLRELEVLASGHLHPGILFLRLLDGFRAAIWPLVIGLITQQGWLIGAAPVLFLWTMIHALVRYITFRYVLTEEELVTTEGLLFRQERRIPVNRIQDLNFEQSIIRRMVGLVVVSVETASGKGAEASLDSLGMRDAYQLREAVQAVRGQRVEEEPEDEVLLFRSTASELTLLGLTNNRVGALIVGFFALFEFADQLGLGGAVAGAGSTVVGRLAGLSPPLLVTVAAAILFLFLLAGWVLAIVASFVKFHDFRLSLREDVLQRRFGLITTRAQTLPRRRVQRVLLEQTLLRRIFDFVVVRADSAGSGMDQQEETRSGRDIIAPATKRVIGERLVPWLLRDLQAEGLAFDRVSPKVVSRLFLQGIVFSVILVGLGWLAVGPWALIALLTVPFGWLFGFLAYHNLGYRELSDAIALRWGILGRYRAFIPLHKVQAAQLEAGPIDRTFGLASIIIYVAGGSPTRLDYLPRDEAERLEFAIAERAAASRFVW